MERGRGLNAAIPLMLIATLSATPVTVTTLDNDSFNGELAAISTESITIQSSGEERTIPVDKLMLVNFSDTAMKTNLPASRITLVDGSSIGFETVFVENNDLKTATVAFGEQLFPQTSVQSIRWGALDEKVSESWSDLKTRDARDDLLVFRKGDVLDYVSGPVTNISEKGVTVTVRGRDLTAPMERVFGIIYANRSPINNPGIGLVRNTIGDQLKAKSLKLSEETFGFVLMTGTELSSKLTEITEIDFGGGRIRFLADLPFDDTTSVAPDKDFPVVWFTAKNSPAGSGGRRPLIIDGKSYQRGLWMHSGATVRFRLNREFSELRALAGFDQTHINRMPRVKPKVKLIVEGDGETLFEQEFDWNDPPAKLNINLSNVRELQIRVASLGAGQGILEHFALGDAQVIK